MAKNNKKQKQNLKKIAKEKLDYPRLPIGEAARITEKVVKDYAGLISYKELSRIGGAGGKTQGGTFGNITKSLKLYGLMDRYGLKEMKVTSAGRKLSETLDEPQKKALLFELSNHIPILLELYKRYEQGIPREIKSITDFLTTVKNLEKREAGRLANLFVKNHKYFGDVDTTDIPSYDEEEENMENLTHSPRKTFMDDSLCEMAFLLGRLIPSKTGENKAFNQLSKLAKEKGFKSLEAFSEAAKYVPSDKKHEMFEKMKDAFEEDSGISLGEKEREEVKLNHGSKAPSLIENNK